MLGMTQTSAGGDSIHAKKRIQKITTCQFVDDVVVGQDDHR
jgi:hypothetical protein